MPGPPETNVSVEVLTMKRTRMLATLALLTSGVACASGESVNIGDDPQRAPSMPSATPSATPSAQPEPDPVTTDEQPSEPLGDYVAEWDGYVEAAEFDSGSDAVHIALDENGHGYLLVGNAPPIATPTDPTAPYLNPPGQPWVVPEPNLNLFEGFRYTILSAKVEARRLRFSVDRYEPYQAWCELQTSNFIQRPNNPPHYSCLDDTAGGGQIDGTCYLDLTGAADMSGWVEANCTQAAYCVYHRKCSCTETGCTNRSEAGEILDAALASGGDELTGTFTPDFMRHTIHLTRQ